MAALSQQASNINWLVNNFVDRECPLSGKPIPQRFTLYVRHNVVQASARLPGVEERYDIRML